MPSSDWQDDYLPTVPHCWASIFDPYRINDVLWEVPYFPGTGLWKDITLWPNDTPMLWVAERFSLPKIPWAENLLVIIKDWVHSKPPIFWDIFRYRASQGSALYTENNVRIDPLYTLLEESSLEINLSGTGEIHFSFLYESRTPAYEALKPTRFYGLDTTIENGGIPRAYSVFSDNKLLRRTRLEIFPEKECNEEFSYGFERYFSNLRYFRRGVASFVVEGGRIVDLRLKQFSPPLGGEEIQRRILLGSVVVSGTPSLCSQAKQQFNWYSYDKIYDLLEKIDSFANPQPILGVIESQGVSISEVGHLYKGDCSASLAYGDWIASGRVSVYWGIVFSNAQAAQYFNGQEWSPFPPDYPYILISIGRPMSQHGRSAFNWVPSWESLPDILNWLKLAPDSTTGVLRTSDPGGFNVNENQVMNYFITIWDQFPNYQLEGLRIGWFPGANRRQYLRQLIKNLSLWRSSPNPGEAGHFFRYNGDIGPENFIIDPIWHFAQDDDIAGTILDPSYVNDPENCFVHAPFDGREWFDFAQEEETDQDIMDCLNWLISRETGLIDVPRIFYPAINNLWNANESEKPTDAKPYRIEWAKRGPEGWNLKHGESGKSFRLDQVTPTAWIDYYHIESGLNNKINVFPFSEPVIEFWLYEMMNQGADLMAAWDAGEKYWYQVVNEARANNLLIGLNMPIDSPRLIELHYSLNAREFAYLPDSTGNKPDRTWTLGKMIDMMAQVLGVCFNPDGTIRSIRQKSVVRNGEEIPVGWAFGQWGINEVTEGSGVNTNGPQLGGTPGEVRPGIVYENRANRFDEDPYTGEPTKILPGDYVLCESLPQYLDQMLDDLDHALNLQELGALAVPAADGTEKKALIEGLGAIVAELTYMLSAISQQTAQGQVSSLKNQAMLYEILKGLGLPLVSRVFPVDLGFDGEPPYSVPFPGLAEDAPALTDLFATVLINLALLQTAIVKKGDVKIQEALSELLDNV